MHLLLRIHKLYGELKFSSIQNLQFYFRLFENFPNFDLEPLKLEILFYFIKIQNLLSK